MSDLRLQTKNFFRVVDPILLGSAILIALAGLVTMASFTGPEIFASRQIFWLLISLVIFVFFSRVDWRFLRRTNISFLIYVACLAFLALLFVAGSVTGGAQSWFNLGIFSIQPADPAKLALIILLAKYFSKRHMEIRHLKHILVSGTYAFLVFVLVSLQPDFGSAVIVFLIWLGMVLVSGISKKHLAMVFGLGALAFLVLWSLVFAPYQKDRILSFVDPLADISGAGYNAFQSVIAIGSGGLFGKGVGYGTQSRLEFLPEFETDFIFAAFSEEWGLIGATILIVLFVVLVARIVKHAMSGETNFEILFGLGLAISIVAHVVVNVGMNLGLLPVTGTPLPFASYGGSHLITEFAALGILAGMARYSRPAHKEDLSKELAGVK